MQEKDSGMASLQKTRKQANYVAGTSSMVGTPKAVFLILESSYKVTITNMTILLCISLISSYKATAKMGILPYRSVQGCQVFPYTPEE